MPTEHSVSGFVIWWFPFYYFSVETIPPLLEGGKEEKHPGIRVLPGTIQSPPPRAPPMLWEEQTRYFGVSVHVPCSSGLCPALGSS